METNSVMNTRKRNNRYLGNRNDYKKRKQFVLEPGMTGFLCTCNFHERGCITDAYRLLNLFADEKSASDINKVLKYAQVQKEVYKKFESISVYQKYIYIFIILRNLKRQMQQTHSLKRRLINLQRMLMKIYQLLQRKKSMRSEQSARSHCLLENFKYIYVIIIG